MTNSPKLTVSGYRGVWGETLTEEIAYKFARAFAKVIKEKGGKRILIGRDARSSGLQLFQAVASAFKDEDLEIDNAGIIPSPSVLLLVRKLSYDAGIIITASHNPIEYNGLKFVLANGLFAMGDDLEKINILKEKIDPKERKNFILPKNEDNEKFRQIHINEILGKIETKKIKEKKYKISLDPINSAGSIIIKELLEKLNCQVKIINEEQNGQFAHQPEPVVKNLKQLSEAVIKHKSDIGFAVDPDADRLVIIDENGNILSEEYTLALAVKNILAQEPSDVVVNMSTSNLCAEIAESFGKKMLRSKVGELNVVNKMLELKSNISGEGNGRVIYPKINPTGDSLVGIVLILKLMATENKKISEIVAELPKYFMQKEKFIFQGKIDLLYKKLKEEFSEAQIINELDGLRFDFSDLSWIHIRPSNTEPKTWIIAESKDQTKLNELFQRAQKML